MDLKEEAIGRSLWRTAVDKPAHLSPDTVLDNIRETN
jgi:hypothetical protein